MAFGKKPDFEPLLGPGRHFLTLQDVESICVGSFAANARRLHLYQRFEAFLQDYLVSGIVGEVWINGSFVTRKPEPNDVDVTVIVKAAAADDLSDDQHELLARTGDDWYGSDIDAFAFIERDPSDELYLDEQVNPARTWYEQYGCENSGEWLKGFGVIRLRETNVGLRLYR